MKSNAGKTNEPLVSFIITCFNQSADMIKECLDSVVALSLSEKEREIILVDDGSETCPLDQLKSHRDNIVYIRRRHTGISAARNTGIEISKGRYIQFVDGEDALIQSAYEHCLDIIRYDSEADIVLFETASQLATQAVFSNSEPESGAIYLHNNSLKASANGYIFKRSVLGNLRFCGGVMYEDEYFTPLLILRAERIISTDAKAYLCRKQKESTANESDVRQRLKRLNDIETVIFNLYELANKMPRNERMALQTRVHQLTMDYICSTITTTRSERQLERRIGRLRKKALFPLQEKKYTAKYKTLSLLTRYKLTRKLLLSVLRE